MHLRDASDWERVLQQQKQVFTGAYATELHVFWNTEKV